MIYVPHNIFRQLNLHSSDVCMVSLVCMAYSFLQRKKDAPYRKHPSLYNFSLSSLKYLFLIFPAIPYYRNNTTSIIGTIHKADCYISSLCLFFSRDYSITHFFTMFKSELKWTCVNYSVQFSFYMILSSSAKAFKCIL